MIDIKLEGDTQLIAKLDAMPGKLQAELQKRVTSLALQMQAAIKRKLSGQVLRVRSGNLRDSIGYDVAIGDDSVTGSVFSDRSVKYGRIHEYGGTINHPGGTAYFIKKDGMAQFVSNKVAFAMGDWPRTKPHTIKMPARAFMRPTLAEYRDRITASMNKAVAESLK